MPDAPEPAGEPVVSPTDELPGVLAPAHLPVPYTVAQAPSSTLGPGASLLVLRAT